MFLNLKNHCLIKSIIKVYHTCDGISHSFHNKSHEYISKMGDPKFISSVVKENLKNRDFLRKKWSSSEIPKLTIYEDKNITLTYHLFFPCNFIKRG